MRIASSSILMSIGLHKAIFYLWIYIISIRNINWFPMMLVIKWKILMKLNYMYMCVAAKLLQLCPTLCDLIDGSPPGSPISGILQARTLEWVAVFFSNAWKWKVKVKLLSRVWCVATPWTAAHQAPPSMGFSWQEYRSGVPLPFLYVRYPSLSFLTFLWGTIISLIFKMRTPRAILL